MNQSPNELSPPSNSPPGREWPGVLCVEDLLGRRREIRLRLGAEEYRLRLTRNNKLILTK